MVCMCSRQSFYATESLSLTEKVVQVIKPYWLNLVVIFIAFFVCHDVLILGKSSIEWRHRPEMIIVVDCDAKPQLKQTIKLFSHNQSSAFLKYLDRFALLHKLHVNQSGEMLVEQMYISIPNVSCILEFKMWSSMGNYCWNYIVRKDVSHLNLQM